MNQIAAQQKQIRDLSAQFMPGIQGALAQITKNLDRPTVVPVKFAKDYLLSEVIRDGQPVKVQIEIEEYYPTTAGFDAEVIFGKAYTADAALLDIEPTKEELARFTTEYLAKKEVECPVCRGDGTYWVSVDQEYADCSDCGGAGFVKKEASTESDTRTQMER